MMHRMACALTAMGGTMRYATVAILAFTLAACDSDAERAVRAQMKDPDAVKFRNVKRCGDEDSTVWTGEFNGKNSYGAYEGYKAFHAEDGVVEFDSTGPIATRCIAQMEAYTRQIIARTKGTAR